MLCEDLERYGQHMARPSRRNFRDPSELHSEGSRQQASARGCDPRRQNRPESHGCGAERDPREDFLGFSATARGHGRLIMVRYADDLVVGFQHESDARRFWDAMRDMLREFSLSLHPDKTRLIEFGRFAAQNCKKRGRSKPETFKFLGFVLICDKSRRGDFRIRRKSRRDRMRAKLREIKEALQRRTNRPI